MDSISKIICCVNYLSSEFMQILIIIFSVLGTILSLIGLTVTPWKFTSNAMEALYIIIFIIDLYSLALSIFIIYVRKKKKEKKVESIYSITSYIIIGLCILSILFCIILAVGIIPDLKNGREYNYDDYENTVNDEEEELVTNGEIAATSLTIIFNIIVFIFLLLLYFSNLIRFKSNINSEFNDSVNVGKKMSIDNLKSITITGNENIDLGASYKKTEDIQINQNKNIDNDSIPSINGQDPNHMKNSVLRYSHKNKYYSKNKCDSVDEVYRNKQEKLEKYIEKYIENGAPNPCYSNFENKTVLNISTMNNSINPAL